MNWSNLAVWNMQIALLAGAATLLAAVFRLRPAPARLAYWQTLLALCVLLIWLTVTAPAPARRGSWRVVRWSRGGRQLASKFSSKTVLFWLRFRSRCSVLERLALTASRGGRTENPPLQ